MNVHPIHTATHNIPFPIVYSLLSLLTAHPSFLRQNPHQLLLHDLSNNFLLNIVTTAHPLSCRNSTFHLYEAGSIFLFFWSADDAFLSSPYPAARRSTTNCHHQSCSTTMVDQCYHKDDIWKHQVHFKKKKSNLGERRRKKSKQKKKINEENLHKHAPHGNNAIPIRRGKI